MATDIAVKINSIRRGGHDGRLYVDRDDFVNFLKIQMSILEGPDFAAERAMTKTIIKKLEELG